MTNMFTSMVRGRRGLVSWPAFATVLAVAAISLVGGRTALAEQECYEASVEVQSLSWNRTLSLPQFDPRKGVLEMVTIEVSGGMVSDVRVENRDNSARPKQKYAVVTASAEAKLSLKMADESLLLTASPSLSRTYNLSAKFDGVLDYGGFSGYTDKDVGSSKSESRILYRGTDDLSPLIGFGDIELRLQALGSGKVKGPGNLIYRIVNRAGAGVTVCYYYRGSGDPPPPPPLPRTDAGTIGFWGNKNGKKAIEYLESDGKYPYRVLTGLYLKNADGSDFDPSTFEELERWLKNADATKMWYMLSAQLAAFQLNVLNGAFGEWERAVELIAWADSLLADYDTTYRAEQEFVKDLLDCANNNFADDCWPASE